MGCKAKNAAGFCRLHKCKLTWRQIKKNGCVNGKKQRRDKCVHLWRYETHPIWEERRKKKQQKKEAKRKKKLGMVELQSVV